MYLKSPYPLGHICLMKPDVRLISRKRKRVLNKRGEKAETMGDLERERGKAENPWVEPTS